MPLPIVTHSITAYNGAAGSPWMVMIQAMQDRRQQAGGDGQFEGQDQPGGRQRFTAAAERAPAQVADEQCSDDDAAQVLRVFAVFAPGQALPEAGQQRTRDGGGGGGVIHGRMSQPSARQG
ncbi:hypothetical protein G6F24_017084 [Rhizopus arrhizus]|nr:hypothetical protein G6F24_017084 [Rhizopus arrhizus]